MKKFFVVCAVVLSCLAILGCGGAGAGGGGGGGGGGTTIVKEQKFWAQNVTNGQSYQLDAELLASNTRCEVWVEKGSDVTSATAQKVANEFSNVYNKLMNGLGWQVNIEGKQTNTMQFADMVGDGNGKLIILLLDIKDGYSAEGDAYVAGYFDPVQFLKDKSVIDGQTFRSNECDMIYMDINPSKIDADFYGTLAHEMQHLMSFVTTVLLVENDIRASSMDLWIDEGLSAAAEWIYSGKLDENRARWYHADPTELIAQGDNFFVWDNYSDPRAVLNDYATVNLFFHWLRLNSDGGSDVYRAVFQSEHHDYQAVTSIFEGPPSWTQWETLMVEWHAANFVKSTNSRFGYRDSLLNAVNSHYVPAGTTSINLFPGEGVFSYAPANPGLSNSSPIIYSYLTTTLSSTYTANSTLLTFNSKKTVEVNESGTAGTTTGQVPPSASIKTSITGTSSIALNPSAYRISAGDMLRRNGHNFIPSSSIPDKNTGRSVVDSKPIPKFNPNELPKLKFTPKD